MAGKPAAALLHPGPGLSNGLSQPPQRPQGSYKVLNEELAIVGAGPPGPKAFSMLDLHGPELNWVRLAEGMGVDAVSVDDTAGLEKAMRLAVEHHGPRLIEAVI
jgi:acetolactate synthase-1/2/3 large subunit